MDALPAMKLISSFLIESKWIDKTTGDENTAKVHMGFYMLLHSKKNEFETKRAKGLGHVET